MLELNRVYCGDCLDLMREMPDKSVDLVLTSPPYNCGKCYGDYTDDLDWQSYWEFTLEWLKESFKLSIREEVGSKSSVVDGEKAKRDVPFTFKIVAAPVGFIFLDKIIWIKGNEQNVNVSGSGWGTYLSPSGPSIRCGTEPILIFSKDTRGMGAISGEGKGICIKGDVSPKEWMEWTMDAWFIRGEYNPDHPAVFPEEIPKRLIKLYTFPEATVLDPFMGSGTTCVACKKLGRNFIGIDKEQAYVDIALKRLEKANNHKITEFFNV